MAVFEYKGLSHNIRRGLQQVLRDKPPVYVWVSSAFAYLTFFLLLFVLVYFIPERIARMAKEKIENKLPVQVHIGDVDIHPWGVVVQDLQIKGGKGALRATVPATHVSWGIFGQRTIKSEGGHLRFQVDHPHALRLIRRMRSKGKSAKSMGVQKGVDDKSPLIKVSDFRLELQSRQGTFLTLQGLELERSGAQFRASLQELTIGKGGLESAVMHGGELRAKRSAEGWIVTGAVAREAELRWLSPEATKGGKKRLLSQLQPLRTMYKRLRAEKSPQVGAESAGGLARILAEGSEMELSDLVIRSVDKEDSVHELYRLRASIKARSPRDWRLYATGSQHRSGAGGNSKGASRTSWRLRIDPELRAVTGRVMFEELPFGVVAPLLPHLPWYEPDKAKLSGTVKLRSGSLASVNFDGRVETQGLALFSPKVAERVVDGIDARVSVVGSWYPLERSVTFQDVKAHLGDAFVEAKGTLKRHGEDFEAEMQAQLAPMDCNNAVHTIPRALLGQLQDAALHGSFGGNISFRIDTRALQETILDISVQDRCRFVQMPNFASLSRVRGPFHHTVLEPDGKLWEFDSGPGSANWAPLASLSPFFVHAVLAHEDAAFYRHRGFAVWAVRDALVENLQSGRYVRGASTISMQLAKNLFLSREKTVARKAREVVLTWWLERNMSKSNLLELYLNIIEYGPGVFGIKEAARHYFQTTPQGLGPAQAAFLAVLLPAPKSYHRQLERGVLRKSTKGRMQSLLRHMHARGRIGDAALEAALAELDIFRFAPSTFPPEQLAMLARNCSSYDGKPFESIAAGSESGQLSPNTRPSAPALPTPPALPKTTVQLPTTAPQGNHP